jgi:DNA-binding LacI/PurR family transcriptional regulator
VVGFDDVALAAYVDPPLTTLSQSTAEMGYWAVASLAERLRPRPGSHGATDASGAGAGRGAGSAPAIMLPVRLEIRGSTGPPRAG